MFACSASLFCCEQSLVHYFTHQLLQYRSVMPPFADVCLFLFIDLFVYVL